MPNTAPEAPTETELGPNAKDISDPPTAATT